MSLISLPDAAEPGAELGPADLGLLHRAKEWDEAPGRFNYLMDLLAGSGPITQAPRARFDLVADYLFGFGFRDPELPVVASDYRAFLDTYRRELGITDAAFAGILAEIGGADDLDGLTGGGFVLVTDHVCRNYGGHPLRLPPRSPAEPVTVGQLHMAVFRLNLSTDEHLNVLVEVGGGCLRTGELDARGARRVLAHYMAQGYVPPEPAPRVSGAPGYITQAQANLVWKLWHDHRSSKDDVSEAALAGWLGENFGLDGGIHSLTAAGARRVLDAMLEPLIALRLAAVEAWKAGAVAEEGGAAPLE